MLVKKEILEGVVFIAARNKEEKFCLKGTAFFVGDFVEDLDVTFCYIVTAQHVIAGIQKEENDGGVYLRMNTKTGVEHVRTEPEQWVINKEETVDAAVFFCAPNQEKYDYKIIDIEDIVSEAVLVRVSKLGLVMKPS